MDDLDVPVLACSGRLSNRLGRTMWLSIGGEPHCVASLQAAEDVVLCALAPNAVPSEHGTLFDRGSSVPRLWAARGSLRGGDASKRGWKGREQKLLSLSCFAVLSLLPSPSLFFPLILHNPESSCNGHAPRSNSVQSLPANRVG